MDAQRGTRDYAAVLTDRRVRSLAHLEPVLELERDKSSGRGGRDWSVYDTKLLTVVAVDTVAISDGLTDLPGVPREQLLDTVAAEAAACAPERPPGEHHEVARWLLDRRLPPTVWPVRSEGSFAAAGVVAGSLTGALGYYALVHALIAQLVPPTRHARAITTNTLWGAFASPVFLSLMAWLVLQLGWRPTLRLTGLLVAAAFAAAAVVVPDSRGSSERPPRLRLALAAAGRDRTIRLLLATTFAGGAVTSLVILYQVPVMVTAGLTLALASGLAGARGLLQLAGRIPMPWLVRRFGARTTLRLAHLLTGVACFTLPAASGLPVAVTFAVVAAIGALIPVESIFSAEAVPVGALGVVLGVASLTRGTGAALGPVVAGALNAVTGTRTLALVLAGGVAVVAAIIVPAPSKRRDHAPAG